MPEARGQLGGPFTQRLDVRARGKLRKAMPSRRRANITFTGERCEGRFQILLNGQPVELTRSTFKALLLLVVARADSAAAFIPMSHVTIYRLRRSLDRVEVGAGKALIATGYGKEYCLGIPKERLRASIAVTTCFSELVELKVVSRTQATALYRLAAGHP